MVSSCSSTRNRIPGPSDSWQAKTASPSGHAGGPASCGERRRQAQIADAESAAALCRPAARAALHRKDLPRGAAPPARTRTPATAAPGSASARTCCIAREAACATSPQSVARPSGTARRNGTCHRRNTTPSGSPGLTWSFSIYNDHASLLTRRCRRGSHTTKRLILRANCQSEGVDRMSRDCSAGIVASIIAELVGSHTGIATLPIRPLEILLSKLVRCRR